LSNSWLWTGQNSHKYDADPDGNANVKTPDRPTRLVWDSRIFIETVHRPISRLEHHVATSEDAHPENDDATDTQRPNYVTWKHLAILSGHQERRKKMLASQVLHLRDSLIVAKVGHSSKASPQFTSSRLKHSEVERSLYSSVHPTKPKDHPYRKSAKNRVSIRAKLERLA
jgi:hypothetical protein